MRQMVKGYIRAIENDSIDLWHAHRDHTHGKINSKRLKEIITDWKAKKRYG